MRGTLSRADSIISHRFLRRQTDAEQTSGDRLKSDVQPGLDLHPWWAIQGLLSELGLIEWEATGIARVNQQKMRP